MAASSYGAPRTQSVTFWGPEPCEGGGNPSPGPRGEAAPVRGGPWPLRGPGRFRCLLASRGTYCRCSASHLVGADRPVGHATTRHRDALAAERRKCPVSAAPLRPERPKIPKWVQRAIYFRDRGMYAKCGRDFTGLVNRFSSENSDHTIPLAQGGLNGATSLKLLCSDCNNKKSDKFQLVSSRYQNWY
ncbi:HNH endonuclease [Streptomyces sp. KLMMK]|uniref:HNH endonuclease n=1 Tax=Streptomyces sp. KLMMK TaxID=3109353 RepID=UPI003FA78232